MELSSPEMKTVVDAIGLLRDDQAAGRARLLELWDEACAEAARVRMCAIAHFLADTEPDTAGELEWDLRALEAATGSRETGDHQPLSPDLTGMLASLQGSVANGYRAQGDLERARLHLGFALARQDALADDDYGRMVRGGLRRLQSVLGLPA